MGGFKGLPTRTLRYCFLHNLVSSVLDFVTYRANLYHWKSVRLYLPWSDTAIFTKTKQGLSTKPSVTK